MNIKLKNFVIFLAIVINTNCAGTLHNKKQNINVRAIDSADKTILNNVDCYLINSDGVKYPVLGNPGIAVVDRAFKKIEPVCIKEGYFQKSFGPGSLSEIIMNNAFSPGPLGDLLMSGTAAKYNSNMVVVMERK